MRIKLRGVRGRQDYQAAFNEQDWRRWFFFLLILLLCIGLGTIVNWAVIITQLIKLLNELVQIILALSIGQFLLIVITGVFSVSLWYYLHGNPYFDAVTLRGQLLVLRLVSPPRFLLRLALRKVRQERILSRLSTIHEPVHQVNILAKAGAVFFKRYSMRMQIAFLLLLGGIFIPLLQVVVRYQPETGFWSQFMGSVQIVDRSDVRSDNPEVLPDLTATVDIPGTNTEGYDSRAVQPTIDRGIDSEIQVSTLDDISFLELMLIGIVSTLVLFSLWTARLFITTRQRHIVLQFDVSESDLTLQPVAAILTQKFVKQLQEIGRLLTLRQVENVNIRLENPLSLFVTSGQEEELVRQLSSWSDFEVSNVRLPLGGLLSLLVVSLADTRVRGSVQKSSDGTLEVWIEFFSRKDRRAFEIERVIIPNSVNTLVDDTILEEVAEELAIRLAFQFGQTFELASSWESLKWFVKGLRASSNRNWWYAISNYQKATEIEETTRGSFGLGHYHIGATLLSQGEPHAALDHLRRAESYGPPSAETHYMLALNLLALNYDRLDGVRPQQDSGKRIEDIAYEGDSKPETGQQDKARENNSPFDLSDIAKQIIYHLEMAVELSKVFPEAEHLIGIVYYQLGRAQERYQTADDEGKEQEQTADVHRFHYLRSIRYFRRAIRDYNRAYRWTMRRVLPPTDAEKERIRVTKEQLMAIHHLADALRSLSFYHLAISYYRDVQIAFPGRVRNLVDQSMTYCQWERFAEGRDFVGRELWQRSSVKWTADARLYAGWAASGSILELLRPVRFADEHHQVNERILEAMARFDLALLLRPRFVVRRRQTEWIPTWMMATLRGKDSQKLQKILADIKADLPTIYTCPLTKHRELFGNKRRDLLGKQCCLWLVWRVHGLVPDKTLEDLKQNNGSHSDVFLIMLEKIVAEGYPTNSLHSELQLTSVESIFEDLKKQRGKAAENLYGADRNRIWDSLVVIDERRKLCTDSYASWESANREWSQIFGLFAPMLTKIADDNESPFIDLDYKAELPGIYCAHKIQVATKDRVQEETKEHLPFGISFALRWQFDLYVQVAVFACRNLAEFGDSKRLKEVASEASKKIKDWIDLWYRVYGNNFRFSAGLVRYNLVTLMVWDAYGKLMSELEEQPINVRLLLEDLRVLQTDVERYELSRHPLFLFVRGKYYQACQLYSDAIDDFTNLLNVTESFDSKSFNPFDFTIGITREDLSQDNKNLGDESPRTQLLYLERVCGQQQFEYFVDNAQVYEALAESLAVSGDLRAAVDYRLRALTWSPFKDLDIRNLMGLIDSLLNLDLFEEALAVVGEAKSRMGNYPVVAQRTSTLTTLNVLECILHSRLEHFGRSLEFGLAIAERDLANPSTDNGVSTQSIVGPLTPFFNLETEFNDLIGDNVKTFIQNLIDDNIETLSKDLIGDDDDVETFIQNLINDNVETFINKFINRPTTLEWHSIAVLFGHLWQHLPGDHDFIDDEDTMIREFQDIAKPDRWMTLPSDMFDPQQLRKWTEELAPKSNRVTIKHSDQLMLHKLRGLVASGAFNLLFQACELYNNISYNLASLGMLLDSALKYSTVAIYVMRVMNERTLNIENLATIEIRKKIRRRLAQYYDTLAWIYYRRRSDDIECVPDLEYARCILTQHSLKYDQGLVMPQYHLARIYIALAEEKWQNSVKTPERVTQIAPHIRHYLFKASHHCRIADKLDHSGRLENELRIYRARIDDYIATWRDTQRYVPPAPERNKSEDND